jgi:hypothetical protein
MRDTQKPLRLSIHSVINGNTTYNGSPVNFYDEKKKVGLTDRVYGLYSTQQTTRDRTSEYWITDELITIELLHKSGFEVTKDFIDDVSDQLYQILMPDAINAALPNPSLMLIQHFELEEAITRSVEITDTETIVSKLITFSCKITQQQP